ncbi:MAG: hemerythrin family protein [Oscillospiraceae bacterium]|nr:hemerythrin family protein [Oscillospiraceae bacterium]
MAFLWTKDMETGHKLIDDEHKKLIKAADDLVAACAAGKGRQELGGAVDFLLNYTRTHFSHEEDLMLRYKYPGYNGQISWHRPYVSAIEEVSKKLKEQGANIALVAEVNLKVSELITHIKTMDVHLAKFLNSQAK